MVSLRDGIEKFVYCRMSANAQMVILERFYFHRRRRYLNSTLYSPRSTLFTQFMVPSARRNSSPIRSRRAFASGKSEVPYASIHWAEAA